MCTRWKRWCWNRFLYDWLLACVFSTKTPDRLNWCVAGESFCFLGILHLNNKNYQVEKTTFCVILCRRTEWGNKRAAKRQWKGKTRALSPVGFHVKIRAFIDILQTLTLMSSTPLSTRLLATPGWFRDKKNVRTTCNATCFQVTIAADIFNDNVSSGSHDNDLLCSRTIIFNVCQLFGAIRNCLILFCMRQLWLA